MNTKETPGLITLTEERLRGVISDAYDLGFCDGDNCGYTDNDVYASRIIEALKKEAV